MEIPHNAPSLPATLLPAFLLLLILSFYFYGMYLLRRKGKSWGWYRATFFGMGICMLLYAFSPALTSYAHHDIRGHMVQHLLIGMLAPLGLVLGAPLTLTLRILPAQTGRRISAFFSSSLIHFLGHPVTALMLNIGGMFLLYLTPLFALMKHHMWLHYLVHFHFLAAGYLFTWSIAGPDPAPGRPSLRLRLLVLFISMASHAYLSKLMYVHLLPRHTTFHPDAIQEAALLMYYGGDLAEVLLAIAFFTVWFRRKINPNKLAPFVR
ncbi:cytochrome c oxidase assembly protein [Nafulsella turpanensis]|uniref:cytochrome c oxidase assembly protein n=1 Tax=Nafulsella turpanensis TaxID=1265690 RepID=UPI00034AFF55|nr:cytochrome c oxidase assembly protein [Nafulsella turpanensis]